MSSGDVSDYFAELLGTLDRISLPHLGCSELEVLALRIDGHKEIILSFITVLPPFDHNADIAELHRLLNELYTELVTLHENILEQIHRLNDREHSSCDSFRANIVRSGELGRPRYSLL